MKAEEADFITINKKQFLSYFHKKVKEGQICFSFDFVNHYLKCSTIGHSFYKAINGPDKVNQEDKTEDLMKILSNGPDTDITITKEYKLISDDGNIMRYENGYWIKCEDFLQYSRYPDKFMWDTCPVTKQGKLVMMPYRIGKKVKRYDLL